jgi:hypothetical protein
MCTKWDNFYFTTVNCGYLIRNYPASFFIILTLSVWKMLIELMWFYNIAVELLVLNTVSKSEREWDRNTFYNSCIVYVDWNGVVSENLWLFN